MEIARWLKKEGAPKIRLEADGMRSQVVALIAAAMEPTVFSEVTVQHGIASLRYLLDKLVAFREAADLLCLDLYKFTDGDRLTALGPSGTR